MPIASWVLTNRGWSVAHQARPVTRAIAAGETVCRVMTSSTTTHAPAARPALPALPLDAWRDTYETVHLWTQVVGKIALACTPLTNHFWNVALQLTPCGLTTLPLFFGERTFTIAFDFVHHELEVVCSDGHREVLVLEPMAVADFYARLMEMLSRFGIEVSIDPRAVEMPNPPRCDIDTEHCSYDRAPVRAFWDVMLAIQPVFTTFRARFLGKCSPVHFFWGSFDLALTRFSGRRAPPRAGADATTLESYSHEVISHGFWPGSGNVREPMFYAYAAPEPAGFQVAHVQPAAAFYADLGEWLLPLAAVRASPTPQATLMTFLQSTYEADADLAGWPRAELERAGDDHGV